MCVHTIAVSVYVIGGFGLFKIAFDELSHVELVLRGSAVLSQSAPLKTANVRKVRGRHCETRAWARKDLALTTCDAADVTSFGGRYALWYVFPAG